MYSQKMATKTLFLTPKEQENKRRNVGLRSENTEDFENMDRYDLTEYLHKSRFGTRKMR